MKIAFLVLAHDRPSHLGRLLNAICDEDCRAFVHIDAKSDITQFSLPPGANAQFTTRRIPVYWGEYSQVEAILHLIEEARFCEDIEFDYFVLLSGAYYPLVSLQRVKSYFEAAQNQIFIDTEKMPTETKPLKRMRYFVPSRDMPLRRKLFELSPPFLRTLVRRPYEKRLGPFVPHAGGTWWALPTRAIEHVTDVVKAHPEMVNFFKNTICPDEMFFQTILCSWCDIGQINPSLTYTDWSAGGNNPATIGQRHIDILKTDGELRKGRNNSGKIRSLFARKFPDDSQVLTRQISESHADRKI